MGFLAETISNLSDTRSKKSLERKSRKVAAVHIVRPEKLTEGSVYEPGNINRIIVPKEQKKAKKDDAKSDFPFLHVLFGDAKARTLATRDLYDGMYVDVSRKPKNTRHNPEKRHINLDDYLIGSRLKNKLNLGFQLAAGAVAVGLLSVTGYNVLRDETPDTLTSAVPTETSAPAVTNLVVPTTVPPVAEVTSIAPQVSTTLEQLPTTIAAAPTETTPERPITWQSTDKATLFICYGEFIVNAIDPGEPKLEQLRKQSGDYFESIGQNGKSDPWDAAEGPNEGDVILWQQALEHSQSSGYTYPEQLYRATDCVKPAITGQEG